MQASLPIAMEVSLRVKYISRRSDTHIDVVQQFMSAIGRKCSVVNLDPANDHTNYECAIDVRDLVKLEDIMKDDELGPNGGILYAMEELEHNMDWLESRLSSLGEDYVIFDCPGQVELFTHHSSLRNIFYRIQKLGYRVCTVLPVLGVSLANLNPACGPQSHGLLLSYTSISLHFELNSLSSCHAADGSSAS